MIIRVLLADDHAVVRSGIRIELLRHSDIEIAAEAVNGDEALALAIRHLPDILILDVNMPGTPVYQIIQQVKTRLQSARILVVSAYGDVGTVAAMMHAGVDGYVLKDDDPEKIVEAVYALYNGGKWLSPSVQAVLERIRWENRDFIPAMTTREIEILLLLVESRTNKEIAFRLEISERTVEFHLDKIMVKLGIRTRIAVALWVQEHKFLVTQ
jgi:DNA-binding NarL/FixJ family response regulator